MTRSKTVLITGAGGGIGSATARHFALHGWQVVLTDFDGDALAQVARELGDAPFVVADLTRRAACVEVVADAMRQVKSLDALVNVAGVWREGPAELTLEEDFDLVIGVNLKAIYFMCAASIPHLKETEGAIVNLSSDAGIQGNTGAALYCASKGGVSILSKALALELALYGVRVNAVCPGDVDSPMLAQVPAGQIACALHPPGGDCGPRSLPVFAGGRTDHRRQYFDRFRLLRGEVTQP